MKPISVHVSENAYQELKSIAAREGRPVAELIRQAMAEFMERHQQKGGSVLDIEPHESGPLRKGWTRAEILDEMTDR